MHCEYCMWIRFFSFSFVLRQHHFAARMITPCHLRLEGNVDSIEVRLMVLLCAVRRTGNICKQTRYMVTMRRSAMSTMRVHVCLFPHPINTLGVQLQLDKVFFSFDKVLTKILLIFMISTLFCRRDFIRKCYVTGTLFHF